MSKGDSKFELTELFMAKADRDRRFFGTIQRGFDSNGHPVVRGKIKVNNGFIWSQAGNQEVLGTRLDEMVLMVLDYGLHSEAGVISVVADMTCFLN